MRCRECGLEVDNDKAFCPVCGAPMKVTADYDYIQAEIANKVDRYFNEDNKDQDFDAEDSDSSVSEDYDDEYDDDIPSASDDMSKTRDVYGNDSIYDEMDDDYSGSDRDYDSDRNYSRNIDPHNVRTYDRPQQRPVRRTPSRKKKKNQTAAKVITVLIIFVIIAAAVVGILGILGMFNRNGNTGNPVAEQTKISLTSNLKAGETYDAPVTVELTNELEGNIFYTLDGTEPSINSKMYTGPFEIRGADVPASSYPSVNLRAISFSEDSSKSGDLNIVFNLTYDETDAPKPVETQTEPETTTQDVMTLSPPLITPDSGSYFEDTEIMVSSPENADIFYTMDGSIPDTSSSLYRGPVKMVPGNSVFTAICIVNGRESEVATREYSLDYGYFVTADTAITNAAYWLFANGYTIDYDMNTADGYAKANHLGTYNIGDYTYYILQICFYNNDGTLDDTQYLGVGVNYGGVEHLGRDGDNYYYN